ncbi:hypothetical protein [Streptomyces sp. SP18BB07]|uniref:hypothetical protein n=1 Tax=Streptomyces sp. SP18BB07 TaxID=3002522 RepID=UPI002E7AA7A8|nr:hypothetical protein [Streptomyces sp. SP18BB07]MEE1764443.1 hypothetical protein [Streptomyces sp. SP18BB07]
MPHDAETRRLLATAGALAPGHARNPARIKATHDAFLKAFERTLNPLETRDDAGSSDGLEETELHRQEIELPGGGQLVISDLEPVTPDRLDEATRMYADILRARSKDHQS